MANDDRFFDLGDPGKNKPEEPDTLGTDGSKGPVEPEDPKTIKRPFAIPREGELGVGVPEPENVQARSMTAQERKRYSKEDAEAEQARLDMLALELTQQMNSFRVPQFIRRIGMWLMLGLASILGLLLVTQVTSALASIAALPAWAQWVVGVLLALVGLVIVALIIKLVLLFRKLQKNEQIQLSSLNALAQREELRALSTREHAKAVLQLCDYLRGYDPAKLAKDLASAGLLPGDIDDLTQARDKLLRTQGSIQPQRWIASFHQDFQAVLDRAAGRMIKGHAKKVGIKTAISPLPILDNAIVLTISLSMVKDLVVIYQLRVGRGAIGLVLLRVVGQAYLAGEIQELTEALSESAVEGLSEHVGQVTAKITGLLGSKTGEGLVNAILIWRLGSAAIKILQPTR